MRSPSRFLAVAAQAWLLALATSALLVACADEKADPCAGAVCVRSPGSCFDASGTCVQGRCEYAPLATGTGCDDRNACTSDDRCDGAGTCGGTPLVCATPPGACYQASGSCVAGACVYPPASKGATCDDLDACTTSDACDGSGVCGGVPTCPTVVTEGRAEPARLRVGTTATVRFSARAADPDGVLRSVTLSLATLGLPGALPLFDDGTHGDAVAGDLVFTADVEIPGKAASAGRFAFTVTATDEDGLTGSTTIPFELLPATPAWRRLQGLDAIPPANQDAPAIWDAATQRVVLVGGLFPTDELWTWTLAGGFTTRKLSKPVPPWIGPAFVHDVPRNRLVFPTGDWNSTTSTGTCEVWALSLQAGQEAWQKLPVSGCNVDGGLNYAQAAYDAPRDRALIYDGAMLWSLTLGDTPTLTEIQATGTPHPGTAAFSFTSDAAHQRVLLFGGMDVDWNEIDQLTQLDLTVDPPAWTALDAKGPVGRDAHVFVYDAPRNRFLLSSGWAPRDVWSLSNDGVGTETWTELLKGSDYLVPNMLTNASAVALPDGRLWLYGGYSGNMTVDDVWIGDPSAATPTTPWLGWIRGDLGFHLGAPVPAERWGAPAGIDSSGSRLFLYEGVGKTYYAMTGWNVLGDLWSLDLSGPPAWTQFEVPWIENVGPSPRQSGSQIWFPGRNAFILGSGLIGDTGVSDAWALTVAPGDPAWRKLLDMWEPAFLTPLDAAADPVNDRILFFGWGGDWWSGNFIANWEWSMPDMAWSSIVVAGDRPGRFDAKLFDPVSQRIVVVDGSSPSLEVHVLDVAKGFEKWARIEPACFAPKPPGGNWMATLGSSLGKSAVYAYGDAGLWRLDLTPGRECWAPMATAGTPPSSRSGAIFAYDAPRNRVVLWGGVGAATYHDLWEVAYLEE